MSNKKKPNFPGDLKGFKFKIYWIYIIIFLFFIGLNFIGTEVTKLTNWTVFNQDMLQEQKVEKVVIENKEKAYVYIKKEYLSEEKFEEVSKKKFGDTPNYGPHYYFEIGSVETFANDLKEAQSSFESDKKISPLYETRNDVFGDILGWILPLAFFIFIWIFIMKRMSGGSGAGGQIFNIGKTQGKLIDKEDIKVSFKDVAGLEEAKEEITEIVDFLKSPTKYTKLGGKIPRGAMLVGPPGTGKTLLAKAVATQSEANFISVRGPELLSKWVGESERGIREIFKRARQSAPCVVFFDEIDSIAPIRGAGGETAVTERVVSQLLTELDGMENMHGVIVLAATNRADMIDPALLRPGRFDKIIQIPLPDKESRKSILKINAEKIPTITEESDPKHIDFEKLSEITDGLSGADTASIANTAVSLVIHEFLDSHPDVKDIEKTTIDAKVTMKHFEEAVKKVREQKDLKLGEKLVASYYR